METEKQAREMINQLKNGQNVCFNMFQDGGSVCYKCNGMYLLFEIPLYGGEEYYWGTYSHSQLDDLIEKAYSLT